MGCVGESGLRFALTAWDALVLLWIVTASAGATTLIAWLIDDRNKAHAKARAGEIIEAAARERN